MGLFNALTAAVGGLQAQSFAIQNISGNIANSQTIAYKDINTSFLDLVSSASVPSQQVAGGVTAYSVATNNVQGAIQSATVGTDMAINGDGYFIVQPPLTFSGSTPIFGGVNSYTRRGDFQLDAQGYLVNGAGYYLEGLPIDPTTGIPTGSVAAPLQFQSNFLPASATTQLQYALNLPTTPVTNAFSSSTPNSELLNPANFGTDPTVAGTGTVVGSDVSTFVDESIDGGSITVYNAAGSPANLQLRWAKIDSVANGGVDTWELFYQTDSTATGATVAWQNAGVDFVFDATGQLNPPITQTTLNNVTINGNAIGNLTVDTPVGSITQFASTSGNSTVNNLQQNGYAAGQLQGIAVGKNGDITGTFSNGQSVALAYIPLVHFNSPNNLKSLDGGAYQETSESGPPLAGASGQIVGQSLESSNADIATEFTKLIVTQQAYSANTKVITTANQMSQDLLNIIR
ncbi:MAG TPA: flagellar hook-basal body complex protein [Pseudolabrys sp.]|nr:flagellar hook-basal body complex protein [Pseudolabrys sp.]